ncbi:NADPH dehydrogenase [Pseudobythopirellula maris]|uniref:NADPH dehydrogenase n=1 Tax=Pseudobythopirellula maris TaxID=2527991 RepID=A0A5C5ZN97_9BACT|nr:NADH:flavin oxidoreductase [Pseudobythopirellula maris]TWT88545.1 NADPH dehydrogenase [Pseudobythopirellula maris]
MSKAYTKIAQIKSLDSLRERLAELGVELPLDEQPLSAAEKSPLAESWDFSGLKVGNRWAIHPMEGWDTGRDGAPSEHTLRRWNRFGLSGAKLIWGGEAAAVVPEGRANPNQTLALESNRAGLVALIEELRGAHQESFGTLDGLVVGLQLTHSGRFCRPNDKKRLEPRIAYHHPLLDAKFGIDPDDTAVVLTDDDVERLIDAYVAAAKLAAETGYQFVDVKACHGYLLHEFLSARRRPGRFGGDLEGRSLALRTIIGRVRDEVPQLAVGVRLSLFDFVPYATSQEVGKPMEFAGISPYDMAFGAKADNPMEMDLTEPVELIEKLVGIGVGAMNLSCGSPYYIPHIQRPAIFPPSDGYLPPEDPLVGVGRQLGAVRECKERLVAKGINVPLLGSGYTYLQDYLPHVAQAAVREGWVDSVGLGRMVLSYPELPADTLAGEDWKRKKVCRTFSDCTTAPRNGIISGCFPLDDYYKVMPERKELADVKKAQRG